MDASRPGFDWRLPYWGGPLDGNHASGSDEPPAVLEPIKMTDGQWVCDTHERVVDARTTEHYRLCSTTVNGKSITCYRWWKQPTL